MPDGCRLVNLQWKKRIIICLWAFVFSFFQISCQSWGRFWDTTPVITYAKSNYWFFQNETIARIVPVASNQITECNANPSLPSGLTLGATDCAISGTPTTTQNASVYTVTATNNGGSATTTLKLRVASTAATRVYGQLGSLTSNTVNNGGLSANSLNSPAGVFVDTGGVYIADQSNNRVLHYPNTATTADRVYGQLGIFTTATANNGGLSAASLNNPAAVFADASGVYIVDNANHRVLYYAGTSTTASRVYGQLGNFATGTSNNGGVSANSLSFPYGVSTDAGGVYILDNGNHRVLYYAGTSTMATRVYGQLGSFATGTANNGGLSANSLNLPIGLFAEAYGVYIVGFGDNRVLHYSGTSTAGSRVYGQLGSYISGTANNGGISANSLSSPYGVSTDGSGTYIADSGNNRVLYSSGSATTANRVYGQLGLFTTGTANNGGLSANCLSSPVSVSIDDNGLYIADQTNHRVLFY
jgi:hypothetical protein